MDNTGTEETYTFKQEKILLFTSKYCRLISIVSFIVSFALALLKTDILFYIALTVMIISFFLATNHMQRQLKRFFRYVNDKSFSERWEGIWMTTKSFFIQLLIFVTVMFLSFALLISTVWKNIYQLVHDEILVFILSLAVFPIINITVNYCIRWWFKYEFDPKATKLFCSFLSFCEVAVITTSLASLTILSDLIKDNIERLNAFTGYTYSYNEYRTMLFFIMQSAYLSCYCTRKAALANKIDH